MGNATRKKRTEEENVADKKADAGQQPGTAIVKIAEEALLAVNEQTVTTFLNNKLTKPEMALFLNLCAMFQLNPFKREVYPIKYKADEPASFVIGYETYLKRAERTKNWAGLETGAEIGENGIPTKAWADVFRKDWTRQLHHEVHYAEYVQTKAEYKNGAPTGKRVPNKMWAEKPITMLKKVAIAQAMRMAFPDEMAGLPYIEEELHLSEVGSIEAKAEELKARAEYEAGKKKPLPEVQDEFTNPEKHPLPPEPDKPAPAAPAAAAPKPGPRPAPDLTDPKVNPFEKPGQPDPSVDIYADAEAAAAEGEEPRPEGPSLKQLEKFAKIKLELSTLGVPEDRMWAGIKKFSAKTLNLNVEETGDLGQPEMEQILGYLNRWRGALVKEKAEKEAQGGK